MTLSPPTNAKSPRRNRHSAFGIRHSGFGIREDTLTRCLGECLMANAECPDFLRMANAASFREA